MCDSLFMLTDLIFLLIVENGSPDASTSSSTSDRSSSYSPRPEFIVPSSENGHQSKPAILFMYPSTSIPRATGHTSNVYVSHKFIKCFETEASEVNSSSFCRFFFTIWKSFEHNERSSFPRLNKRWSRFGQNASKRIHAQVLYRVLLIAAHYD